MINNFIVNDIENFAMIPIKAGEKRKIVNRYMYGIVFSPHGKSIYIQNGKSYINDNKHVLLLPYGGNYIIECETGDICPLINFECDGNFSQILSFEIDDSKKLLEKFDKFEKSYIFRRYDVYFSAMAYVYEILSKLMKYESHEEIKTPQIMRVARRFIEENYASPNLNNDMIAENINVSTVYFRKIFTQVYGKPPMKYISDMRIRKAKLLLREQIMSIEEVSNMVGYANVYSFSRAFKKSVMCSPSAYKKRCLRLEDNFCGKSIIQN